MNVGWPTAWMSTVIAGSIAFTGNKIQGAAMAWRRENSYQIAALIAEDLRWLVRIRDSDLSLMLGEMELRASKWEQIHLGLFSYEVSVRHWRDELVKLLRKMKNQIARSPMTGIVTYVGDNLIEIGYIREDATQGIQALRQQFQV